MSEVLFAQQEEKVDERYPLTFSPMPFPLRGLVFSKFSLVTGNLPFSLRASNVGAFHYIDAPDTFTSNQIHPHSERASALGKEIFLGVDYGRFDCGSEHIALPKWDH
ncbi:uncharacterized protein VTP21DRAFT_10583 [Calcarisporiella thermophila]|uniref:uncharacterized protein n=1 Tax=Calcarisporiella thermophila TaxID=911321 RepID=UPI00374206F7